MKPPIMRLAPSGISATASFTETVFMIKYLGSAGVDGNSRIWTDPCVDDKNPI